MYIYVFTVEHAYWSSIESAPFCNVPRFQGFSLKDSLREKWYEVAVRYLTNERSLRILGSYQQRIIHSLPWGKKMFVYVKNMPESYDW